MILCKVNDTDTELLKPGDLPLKQPGFCLNARGDWLAHAIAFEKAAKILAEHAMETVHSGDLLVHPIVFLFRHHIELRLKEILTLDGRSVDYTHSLATLWRDCRALLSQLGISVDGPESPETIDFENCITQLDGCDVQSDAFRYPFTTRGNLQSLESVDVKNLVKVMEGMAHYLDCVRESVAQALGH